MQVLDQCLDAATGWMRTSKQILQDFVNRQFSVLITAKQFALAGVAVGPRLDSDNMAIVHTLIMTWLDYCLAPYGGLPLNVIWMLLVQYLATRLLAERP